MKLFFISFITFNFTLFIVSHSSLLNKQLNPKQFQDYIENNSTRLPSFVLFHSPWCSHSRHILTEFKQLKQKLYGHRKGLVNSLCGVSLTKFDLELIEVVHQDVWNNVSQIDTYRSHDTLVKTYFKVEEFPSLRLYMFNKSFLYLGGITSTSMEQWLFKKLKAGSCFLYLTTQIKQFLSNSPVIALLILPTRPYPNTESEYALKQFNRIGRLTEDVSFGWGNYKKLCPFLMSSFSCKQINTPIIFIIRPRDHFIKEFPYNILNLQDNDTVLMKFIAFYRLPYFIDFNSDERIDILWDTRPKLIFIYNRYTEKEDNQILQLFRRITIRFFPEVILGISGVHTALELQLLRFFSLDPMETNYTVVMLMPEGDFYQFKLLSISPHLMGDQLLSFIESVLSKSRDPYLRSTPQCQSYNTLTNDSILLKEKKELSYGSVQPLTRKLFFTYVINSKEAIFVLFHNDRFKRYGLMQLHIFRQLAKNYRTSLHFVSIDLMSNNLAYNDSFNTILEPRLYLPNNKHFPILYTGNFSINELTTFISMHAHI